MIAKRVTVTATRVKVKATPERCVLHNSKDGEDCFVGGPDVTVVNGWPFLKQGVLPREEHGEVWAVCLAGKTTTIHVMVW